MTSKERVLAAINKESHDRPPIFTTLTPQVARQLSEHLCIDYEKPADSLLSTRISHSRLLTALGNDCVGIAACTPIERPVVISPEGIITNEYGMVFKNSGLYNEFYQFPLKDAEFAADIENYNWFDPELNSRFTLAKSTVKEYSNTYAIVADLETTIYETAWYMTGLEKLLLDLLMEPEYLNPLLDKIMNINLVTGKKLIEAGADILWAGDDFGSQSGMIMDTETWRSHFKPRIKFLFEEFKKVNPNIKIAWHTCGSVLPIIPDFIEIGLDILNPLQPLATGMNPEFLVSEYGRDLVFFGGIDIQELLPKGPVSRIKDEVNRRIEIFGRYNGYIIAPAHNIQPDTPVEHILAFFDAALKFKF
ncbi:MAG: uroporphyrinogen decarboxylase family protein [Bacteroidales bacterium]